MPQIRLVISVRYSRTQQWSVVGHCDTLDKAIEWASKLFAQSVNGNAYVDVRIEQQAK